MALEAGTHVIAEAESTERRPRAGIILEVVRGDPSLRYRIRWDDVHETVYTPVAGSLAMAEPATSPGLSEG